MSNEIEIYVRPGGEHNMMNIYIPEAMKERFIDGLSTGVFEVPANAINFEISVQETWVSDLKKSEREEIGVGFPVHVRVPLKSINTYYSEG